MQYFDILKRAGKITWGYKALWIFGILVALVSGGGNGGSSGNSGASGNWPESGGWGHAPHIPAGLVIGVIALLLILLLLFFIAGTLARYLGETALIKMVNDYEESEVCYTLPEGFRLAWSPAAGRLFLLDLIVWIPLVIFFIGLLFLAGAPLLLWTVDNFVASVAGILFSVGAFLVVLPLLFIIGALVTLLQYFFRRVCVLEGAGVFAALQGGATLVFQHPKEVFLMGLLMCGVNLLGGLGVLLVVLVLLLLALMLSGLPALLAGGLAAVLFDGAFAWVVGGLVFLPAFFALVIFPSLLLRGVFETFKSTVWTLVYRELN
ncbi:MAG TPA: hypothetical protein G4N98_02965 [Thermoflexia bacterium]|nr:hypothetical protein [Thermoflexia bacterium]